MNKNEALDLALEALEYLLENKTIHYTYRTKADEAITAIKQARALDKMAENARELGLDYEPAHVQPAETSAERTLQHLGYTDNGGEFWKPPLGKPAPDLQAELDATNRQVEILSDALAESRRQCKWPTCKSEEYQQVLAEQIKQELVTGAAQQEPLEYWNAVEGWVKIDEVREHFNSVGCGTIYKTAGDGRVPLTAAQRTWVGLTDEEIEKLRESFATRYAIEAIEAKLKEKNT